MGPIAGHRTNATRSGVQHHQLGLGFLGQLHRCGQNRRAIRFLEEGDRVKVTVQFRGREVSHAYIGRDLLDRFAEQVGALSLVL